MLYDPMQFSSFTPVHLQQDMFEPMHAVNCQMIFELCIKFFSCTNNSQREFGDSAGVFAHQVRKTKSPVMYYGMPNSFIVLNK